MKKGKKEDLWNKQFSIKVTSETSPIVQKILFSLGFKWIYNIGAGEPNYFNNADYLNINYYFEKNPNTITHSHDCLNFNQLYLSDEFIKLFGKKLKQPKWKKHWKN